MRKRYLVIGIVLLFIFMSFNPSYAFDNPVSSGNTLYVGGSGEGNYSRIQDAIDNASDGDIIYVFNGDYYEYLQINKKLLLMGEDKNYTKIIGNDTDDIITINSDLVTIKGFFIGTKIQYWTNYCGIISYGNYTTIIENDFIYNERDILIEKSSNNNISNNYFSGNYRNIIIIDSNYNNISNNYFYDIYFLAFEFTRCDNSYISNNTIIDSWDESTRIYNSSNNTVINNTIMNSGPGLHIVSSSNNNSIIGNIITNCFDGIYIGGDENLVSSNIIINNSDGICISGNNNIISSNFLDNNFWEVGVSISGTNNICENNYIDDSISGINLNKNDNIVQNNILRNNNYGINIQSSGNIVNYNEIENAGFGVYIQSSGSIVNYNEIENAGFGVYIYNASDNYICYNNIYNSSGMSATYRTNIGKCQNFWDSNYYERPRLFPKIILGFRGILFYHWNGYYSVEWWLYIIPVFNIDKHPAKEPYDI